MTEGKRIFHNVKLWILIVTVFAILVTVGLILLTRVPAEKKSLKQRESPIHVLVQWFNSPIPQRYEESFLALKKNIENPFITKIHFLQSRLGPDGNPWSLSSFESFANVPGFPYELFLKKVVVTSHDFEEFLTASIAFQYANLHLKKQICIFSNLDIYFDNTLSLLLNSAIDLSFINSYFLSRYDHREPGEPLPLFEYNPSEKEEGTLGEKNQELEEQNFMQMEEIITETGARVIKHRNIGDQCGSNFIGSHDSIIFIPPLPAALISRCHIDIGSWGIENRLMWEFEQFGIKARNPCLDIHTWHTHKSSLKTTWMPMVNTENKSRVAYPEHLSRMRIDIRKGKFEIGNSPLTGTMMLGNQHSSRCLFSRIDRKFGHARCNENSIDQHFDFNQIETPSQVAPPQLSYPFPIQLSNLFLLVGRQSKHCLSSTDTWVEHQNCSSLQGKNEMDINFEEVEPSFLWRFIGLPSGALLLRNEKHGNCVYSNIYDSLGMVNCDVIDESMRWKLDQLHLA